MDFKDQIKLLGEKVEKLKPQILTEEATKNAFVMPFIQCIGYDVFDPMEVVPEFVADLGIKKGEKVDYAIFKDGNSVILIECKHWAEKLDPHNSQLFRYFHVSKAKFSILTNGIVYRFYTDLVEPNKMDEKPFLEINITDLKDNQIEEVKKFHKSYFDLNNIVSTATELKYTNEFKILIQNEFNAPSDAFVRHFSKQVFTGVLTTKQMEIFTPMVKKSLNQYVSDQITERLKSALEIQNENEATAEILVSSELTEDSKIVTTTEELEGFYIIRAISRKKVEVDRVVYRDAQSYFAILLDDNRLKTICRLYMNGSKKYIGIIDDQKKEIKNEISTISDIYKFETEIYKTIDFYESVGR